MFDAAWYDEAMATEGARALEPLESSPWLQLYQAAAKLIANNREVVDLGCGTGRFIEQLYRYGHYGNVTGVDFAPAVLEEARAYTRGRPAEYQLADLADYKAPFPLPGGIVFTCLEVLEHIHDDLSLVERIPPGRTFVFSVPNFQSQSHVRWFHGVGDVFFRYSHHLEFVSWRLLRHGDKATHLLETVRRSDGW